MAKAVEKSFHTGRHLLVEAPPGVGKSLAYLVPLAALFSASPTKCGGRVVISTYTKALQRQLVEKDIPFLNRTLDTKINYALCIGGQNYLCLRRLDQMRQQGLFDQKGADNIGDIFRWASVSKTGLCSEVALPSYLWEQVSRQGDICFGKNCKYAGACFWRKAKTREMRAQVLVVNHHLFFANMASGEQVLPEFKAVIFDEAHQIEETAAAYLGIEISNRRINCLLDSILSTDGLSRVSKPNKKPSTGKRSRGLLARMEGITEADITRFSADIYAIRANTHTWTISLLEQYGGHKALRLRLPGSLPDPVSDKLKRLIENLGRLTPKSEEDEKELIALIERCCCLLMDIEHIQSQDLKNHVYWVESTEQRFRLMATPVDLSALLRNDLFKHTHPVIMTSATLSTDRSFNFIKRRIGIDEADELILNSPFDFESNAILYLPENIPDPRRTDDYTSAVIEHIEMLARLNNGRLLALFTSYKFMRETREKLQLDGLKVMMQGDAESYALVERFKASTSAILLGTATFWQGIDIPGDALKCVVITRLPFAVPDNPVMEARFDLMRRQGLNPFNDYQVPSALLMFKQGFGRLIRTKKDRGIVTVLDKRILAMNYGKRFLDSLPQCSKTGSFKSLKEFVNQPGEKQT